MTIPLTDAQEAARIAAAYDKRQHAPIASREARLRYRQPEVVIKMYKNEKEFNRDAKKMLRDGWTMTNQSMVGSQDGMARKIVKFSLFVHAILEGANYG